MALIQYEEFLSVGTIDLAATVVLIVIAAGVIYKLIQWSKVVPTGLIKDAKTEIHTSGMVGLFFSELGQRVLAQRAVFAVSDATSRRIVHLLVFWGFLGLAFATVWDDIFFRSGALPPPFSTDNFGNIVGNIGGAAVIIGMTVMVIRYGVTNRWRDTYKGDMSFLFVLYLATITGFATEFLRFSIGWAAFGSYSIHLAFVAALLITAPFTHFFHAILTPITRYIEGLNNKLAAKGRNQYPYYRKLQMAHLADDVREGNATPTYPEWLVKKPDAEEKAPEK